MARTRRGARLVSTATSSRNTFLSALAKMLDPLSGNSKATRSPPLYQQCYVKVPSSSPSAQFSSSPPLSPRGWRPNDFDSIVDDDSMDDEDADPFPSVMHVDENDDAMGTLFADEECTVVAEAEVWERAIECAIDEAKDTIDLSNRRLTSIPASVSSDLSKLVVFSRPLAPLEVRQPFIRTPSVPVFAQSNGRRMFQRAITISALSLDGGGGDEAGIRLFLMNNQIPNIPVELCGVRHLAVLSLRGNRLTSLPDCIGLLTNLKELNVANNLLSHLPASLLRLSLRQLSLHPNPFVIPDTHDVTAGTLGPMTTACTITLKELCIRSLVSPRPEVPIENYTLPLEEPYASVSGAASLYLSVTPKQKNRAPANDGDLKPMLCPNPAHKKDEEGEVWFVEPGEQRLEWRADIAGVNVSTSGGSLVPILWKGCSPGCLAFLNSADRTAVEVL